jgi:hypothetical protein
MELEVSMKFLVRYMEYVPYTSGEQSVCTTEEEIAWLQRCCGQARRIQAGPSVIPLFR